MNLKNCKGRVPIFVGGDSPYKLVDFPSREKFDEFFKRSKPQDRDKYWEMLQMRINGYSFQEVGLKWKLTRERIRQIEAKFLRKLALSLTPEKP